MPTRLNALPLSAAHVERKKKLPPFVEQISLPVLTH
jgi:hypothetical protein